MVAVNLKYFVYGWSLISEDTKYCTKFAISHFVHLTPCGPHDIRDWENWEENFQLYFHYICVLNKKSRIRNYNAYCSITISKQSCIQIRPCQIEPTILSNNQTRYMQNKNWNSFRWRIFVRRTKFRFWFVLEFCE